MKRMTIEQEIERLNQAASVSSVERAERRAQCMLMGHEPSREGFLTNPPLYVCLWCLNRFHRGEFGYAEPQFA